MCIFEQDKTRNIVLKKKRKRTYKTESTSLNVNGRDMLAKVYWEDRRNVRFSLTGTAAHLRWPLQMPKEEREKHWERFKDWLKETLNKNEKLTNHLFGREYTDGAKLTVGKHQYTIQMQTKAVRTHTAKFKDNVISLTLSNLEEGHHLQKTIRHLVSRCVANHRTPDITERVFYWNDHYFQKPIRKVNFKLNQTNWGSCSTRGNINLSTRLLFAPDDVIDYVIVHELSHLIEMNHSPKFWAIVAKVMPDYKKKEQWLKENTHLCNF